MKKSQRKRKEQRTIVNLTVYFLFEMIMEINLSRKVKKRTKHGGGEYERWCERGVITLSIILSESAFS